MWNILERLRDGEWGSTREVGHKEVNKCARVGGKEYEEVKRGEVERRGLILKEEKTRKCAMISKCGVATYTKYDE